MSDPVAGRNGAMRLDRFLWFARLVKTRSAAQDMAEAGTLRLDGPPAPADITCIELAGEVRKIEMAVAVDQHAQAFSSAST